MSGTGVADSSAGEFVFRELFHVSFPGTTKCIRNYHDAPEEGGTTLNFHNTPVSFICQYVDICFLTISYNQVKRKQKKEIQPFLGQLFHNLEKEWWK